MPEFSAWIEVAAQGVELAAVGIMIGRIAVATVYWLARAARSEEGHYRRYRISLAKSLQIGLELLVAADIIRTVALDATLEGVATLGALVLVRTFLGWSLTVETEGHWPWRAPTRTGSTSGAE